MSTGNSARALLLLAASAAVMPLQAAGSQRLPAPRLTRLEEAADGRIHFKSYGSDQGLYNASLYTVAQDAEGYLWAGTEGGAYQFDGTRFTQWSLAQGLPSSSVTVLHPESDGTLWMGTMAGLAMWRDGVITTIPAPGPLRIYSVVRDRAGVLHVGSEGGLFTLGSDGALHAPPRWLGGGVSTQFDSRAHGGLLIAADRGGLWLAASGGTYAPLPGAEGLPAEPVKALITDGAGRLWARTAARLFRQDAPGAPFVDLSAGLPDLRISIFDVKLSLDKDGALLVPSNSGLVRITGDSWSLLGAAQGLPTSWCNIAYHDREGSLWVASEGLHRLKGLGIWSSHGEAEGLPNSIVWGLARDADGRLLASTSGGLARLGPGGWRAIPSFAGLTSYHLTLDKAGDVWAVGPPMQILRLKRVTDQIEKFPLGSGGGRSAFTNLFIAPDGDFWIGTFAEGLHRMRWTNGRPRSERVEIPGAAPDAYIHDIKPDREGRLWVSGDHGLACLENGRWTRFGVEAGLRNPRVFSLAFMPDGSFWASYGEPLGITRLRYRDGRLEILGHLGAADGLSTDQVYSLGVDARGDLWMGTSRAINRLHDGRVIRYGAGDGVRGEDFNYFSFLADPDGDVWMGNTTALVHYRAARDRLDDAPPAARLTRLAAGDRPLPARGDARQRVPFRDRTLEFGFTALSFLDESALRFQVRMEGLGEDWRDTGVREARYPALPPGLYRFEVRAARGTGPYGPAAAREFEIIAPPWRRGWAYALYAAALAALAYAVVRLRTRALRRRNAELERVVRERTRALEELSTTDPVTGLRNRRHLEQTLPERLAVLRRAHRDLLDGRIPAAPQGVHLGFFMLDLDRFKAVNDRHGHAAGDRFLAEAGRRLISAVREGDLAIRWGGEEFLFIAALKAPAEAAALAARLRELVGGRPFLDGEGVSLEMKASIGFTVLPFGSRDPDRPSWEALIRVADHCLYAAKRGGRDAWVGLLAEEGAGVDIDRLLADTPAALSSGGVRVASSLPGDAVRWEGPVA